jgi:hypothetical protein
MERDNKEGEIPVFGERTESSRCVIESSFLGLKLKSGDKLLPRLNMDGKPIVNKYCEGKMKRTLKRELKDLKPLRRKR